MATPSIVPKPEELNRLRNLNLIARWAVEGFISGLHRSPYHGYSAEFMEYRDYVAGDDLRHLDWKVYGRSDRTYIKRFESETNLRSYILLDTSMSMAYAAGERDKLAYAFRRPKSGARHRQELFTALGEIKPAGQSSFRPVLDELAERITGRSLIVILSDFYGDIDEIAAGLRHLRFKRHEVLALHLVDPTEKDFDFDGLLHLVDLETGARLHVDAAIVREAYRKQFEEHVSRLDLLARDCLVDHHVLATDAPFAEALAAYLNRRAQLRH
jgi:uncharacterized protein (DUF58 family)